jgi:hypothetical protein
MHYPTLLAVQCAVQCTHVSTCHVPVSGSAVTPTTPANSAQPAVACNPCCLAELLCCSSITVCAHPLHSMLMVDPPTTSYPPTPIHPHTGLPTVLLQVLNYGQSVFEGMKAQRSVKGDVVLFRCVRGR